MNIKIVLDIILVNKGENSNYKRNFNMIFNLFLFVNL